MAETLLVGTVICLLIALAVSLITLRMLQKAGLRMQAQQQAWEHTQEVRQQQWTALQERQALDIERRQMDAEQRLKEQTQQLHSEWQALEQEDKARAEKLQQEDKVRAEKLQQQFEAAIRQVRQEYELARLPRIEDMPLPPSSKEEHDTLAPSRQAPDLKGADLSKRDLSSRYLSHGDLRDARLIKTNLFMADLSWAHLTNANLTGANLSASNLSHTDLRGANLEGADFLVTDLDNTILIGANLQRTHNLTPEQLRSAIYNETTRFDSEITQALQRKADARQSISQPPTEGQEKVTAGEKEEHVTGSPDVEVTEENKDVWHDTPLPQEKAESEEKPAENVDSPKVSSKHNKIPDQPEEIAENA